MQQPHNYATTIRGHGTKSTPCAYGNRYIIMERLYCHDNEYVHNCAKTILSWSDKYATM